MTNHDDAFRAYLRTGDDRELRAAGEATGSAGGFLVPPAFRAQLAVQLKAYARMVADYTPVETETAAPMVAPGRSAAVGDAVMTTDQFGSPVTESVPTFTSVTLSANPIASYTRVSVQLELDSGIDIAEVVTGYLAENIGRKLSALSYSGTGSGQPLGISTLGVSVVRGADVLATARALISGLDPAYYDNAKFYLGATDYAAALAATGIVPNLPLTLYGFPVVAAPEATPKAVFGDLTAGMYFRSAGFRVVRSVERFGDTLQVSYAGSLYADLQLRDGGAFAVTST